MDAAAVDVWHYIPLSTYHNSQVCDWPENLLLITFATILQLTPFDPTKKKKKKKVVIQDPSDEVDKLSEKTESLTGVPNAYGKEFP
jgi:hypothetical protein